MKALVLKGGKLAQTNEGVMPINGLSLRLDNGGGERFYDADDPFFKLACPENTKHDYITLKDGKINLL